MGEVWRARDTTLRREVAIKTLPAKVARDPTRLARLEREATLLAALNHPNIAVIHGLEESAGTRFLVMELVDGPTLGDRLRRGPLPAPEAVGLALQIAESLEAAHDKGIVHRDLKPDNVKLTAAGRVKVLDFGLARAVDGDRGGDAPTLTAATDTLAVAGTPAYMSPEQARGEDTDHRTDIWAFGVVLYELLTGVSPFRRETTADTIAQVIGGEADDSRLEALPHAVRRIVRRCLEKDLRRRYRDIGDVRLELEDAAASPESGDAAKAAGQAPGPRLRLVPVLATVLAVAAAAAGAWFVAVRWVDTSSGIVRWSDQFREPPLASAIGLNPLAITPDGARVAYVSSQRLWIREMTEFDPSVALDFAGVFGSNPFFSPDGRWVGLFRVPNLVKVALSGGPPITLAPSSARAAGATWLADGTIVFATTNGVFRVPESGGEPQLLVRPDTARGERLYAWPESLPDGRTLLLTIVPEAGAELAQIALLDIEARTVTPMPLFGTSARYVPSGHLVYSSGPSLRAVAFDPDRREVLGDPVSLDVAVDVAADNGAASFAVSDSGTLVYLPPLEERPRTRLTWLAPDGVSEPLPFPEAGYGYPRVSPDGRYAAVEIFTQGNRDIWILDLGRLTSMRLTNTTSEEMLSVWSPTGDRLFFASDRLEDFDIYSQTPDGAGEARLEYSAPGFQVPASFAPDGARLLVYEDFQSTSVLDLSRPDALAALFHTPFNERLTTISRDGNWVAYESDESGEVFEVFIRPFPGVAGGRRQVSSGGGRYPLWSPTTDELFYVNRDGDMMAVPITFGPTLTLGQERRLFRFGPVSPSGASGMLYDVSPVDGRFLTTRGLPPATAADPRVSIVLHFDDELAARVPVP